jgi:outer membrane protein
MKKVLLVICSLWLATFAADAQGKYAIIDTKYILIKCPRYKDAQKGLTICYRLAKRN